MNRDKEAELDKQMRDARRENKYHLVQNYNNDLIRKSLKSQNNQNRLNIKEHKANLNLETITKRLEERNKKRPTQGVSHGAPLKSLAAPRRNEELEIEIANPVESTDKGGLKVERGSNYSYAGNTISSNTTPNSNMSFSTNKSHRAVAVRDKAKEVILQTNQKLMIKNSLIQRLKKRTTSKASSKSNRSSFSRDAQSNKLVSRQTAEPEAGGRIDDRILHLTLNGAKHNTNLVQINNYINKPHRDEAEVAGVADNKSHRMSANSNASNVYSSKLKKLRKPESMNSKDVDILNEAKKVRKEVQNPLKLQTKLPFAQPMLASIQNKNVLTLTQNLLQKRNRNE